MTAFWDGCSSVAAWSSIPGASVLTTDGARLTCGAGVTRAGYQSSSVDASGKVTFRFYLDDYTGSSPVINFGLVQITNYTSFTPFTGYGLSIGPTNVRATRFDNASSATNVVSATRTSGGGHLYTVEYDPNGSGYDIRVYEDGNLLASGTDSNYDLADHTDILMSFNISTGGAYVDNLQIMESLPSEVATTCRVGVNFTTTPSDPQTLDPATNPGASAALLVVAGVSANNGPNLGAGPTLTSDSFGGTWTNYHNDTWATRRRLNVWGNTSFTTPSGSVAVDFTNNQDECCGMLIAEGTNVILTEDDSALDASGTSWTASLTTGKELYVVFIQMEDTIMMETPTGWSKLFQRTLTDGLRSLACFIHHGTPASLSPSFTWASSNGYSAWAGNLAEEALTAPAAITDLTAQSNNASVDLAWSAPANGGSAITDYEYRVDGGTWTSTGSTATNYTVTGLTNHTSYTFEVRAVNAIGNAATSNVATEAPHLYNDHFDRADSTGLGAGYTDVTGQIDIVSQAAEVTATFTQSEANYNTAIGDGTEEIAVFARFTANMTASDLYPGVILSEATANNDNCMKFSVGAADNPTAYLTRVVGGTSTDIATYSHGGLSDGEHTLEMRWVPSTNTWRCFLDGTEITWGTGTNVDGNIDPLYIGIAGYANPASNTIRFLHLAGDNLAPANYPWVDTCDSTAGYTSPGTLFTSSGGSFVAAADTYTEGVTALENPALTGHFTMRMNATNDLSGTAAYVAMSVRDSSAFNELVRVILYNEGFSNNQLTTVVKDGGSFTGGLSRDYTGFTTAVLLQMACEDNGDGTYSFRVALDGVPYLHDDDITFDSSTLTEAYIELYDAGVSIEYLEVADGLTLFAPGLITNLSATPGNTEVVLSWSAPLDGGDAITGYEYRVDGGTWTSTGSASPGVTVGSLTNGVEYDFEVRAVNSTGNSPASNLVAATPVGALSSAATISLSLDLTGAGQKVVGPSTTLAVELATAGTGQKSAGSGSSLSLGMATVNDDAKTGDTSGALDFDLALDAAAQAILSTAASLGISLDLAASSLKAGASSADLQVLLDVVATSVKDGLTDAAIDLLFDLVGAASKTASAAASLPFELGLVATASTDETKAASAAIDLAVQLLATVIKTGSTTTALGVVLDLAVVALKVRAVAATTALALDLSATADKSVSTTTGLDIQLTTDGTSDKSGEASTTMGIDFDLVAANDKSGLTAAGIGLQLDVNGQVIKSTSTDAVMNLALDLVATAEALAPGSTTSTLALALAIVGTVTSVTKSTASSFELALDLSGTAVKEELSASSLALLGVDLDLQVTALKDGSVLGLLALELGVLVSSGAVKSTTSLMTLTLAIAALLTSAGADITGQMSIIDLTPDRTINDLTDSRFLTDLTNDREIEEVFA